MIPQFQSVVYPWSLSFVTQYWDARFGISQADATERVSAWAPIKGSNSLAQATAAAQPILCFLPETRMLFKSGFKRVKDSLDGEDVFQCDGTYKPVLAKWTTPFEGSAVWFTARGCLPVGLTPEHKVLRVDGRRIQLYNDRKNRYENKHGKPYEPENRKRNRNGGRGFVRDLRAQWTDADKLRVGDYMLLPKPVLPSEYQTLSIAKTTSNYSNKTGDSFLFDEEMAFVLGWWLAEGHFSRDTKKRITGLVFSLCGDELHIAKKLEEILERRMKCSASIQKPKGKNACSLYVTGAAFARCVESFFGSGAHNKRVPDFVLNSPVPVLREFVKAYASGDGCIVRKKGVLLRISTVSEAVVGGMMHAFMKLGVPATINHQVRKDGRECFYIGANGEDVEILLNGASRTERTQRKWFDDEKNFYVPITKIWREQYKGEVWDFTSDTKTLGVPFVVHNCPYAGVNYLWLPGVTGNNCSYSALTAPGTNAFTYSTKVKVRSFATPSALIGSLINGCSFRVNTDGTICTSKSGVIDNTSSTGTVSTFVDVVVTYVRSGTTGTYYIDGVSAGTTTDSNNYTVGASLLGERDSVGTGFLSNTSMYWARAYNVALTPSQVVSDAAGTVQSGCIFNANIAVVAEGATTFTESSSNGATVTINSTGAKPAQIVGSQQLLFDGSAFFLKASAFTLNQPATALLVGQQVTWSLNDYIVEGDVTDTGIFLYQSDVTPKLSTYAGTQLKEATGLLALKTNAVMTGVLNGASSALYVNLTQSATGNAGAGNPAGLTLGGKANGSGGFSNIQVKSLAILNSAPSQARLNQLIRAMAAQYGVAV